MPDFSSQINSDGTFSPETIETINKRLYDLADEYSIETFPAEHRNHLGVSLIGDVCSRKLFYSFRWVKLTQANARMRRLWNRGHDEEERFNKLLSWMGFFVRETDPLTDKQYKFSKLNGHYGGSTDSLALLPWFRKDGLSSNNLSNQTSLQAPRILVEYKTHNDKSFKKLKDLGLKKSKPLHYNQMSCYGREFGTRYGLYCAVNKNDDDLYFEFLELDWQAAILSENKAEAIITSKVPPPKYSNNPATFECQYCDFQTVCHYGEVVDTNCRSCKFASPAENATWYCHRWNNTIPKDYIAKGCPEHLSINE